MLREIEKISDAVPEWGHGSGAGEIGQKAVRSRIAGTAGNLARFLVLRQARSDHRSFRSHLAHPIAGRSGSREKPRENRREYRNAGPTRAEGSRDLGISRENRRERAHPGGK